MAKARAMYNVVGRYMEGTEVTGYHLMCMEEGKEKSGKYTKEQMYYLVGRGQVVGVTGQIYKDQVLLRGEGFSLADLPVQEESGNMRNTGSIPRIKKGMYGEAVMNMLTITAKIVDGTNKTRIVGYVVANHAGGTKRLAKNDVFSLASEGKLTNARVQLSNGKPILRGVAGGDDLSLLPCIEATPVQ